MDENDSFLYSIQEIISFHQFIPFEDDILNQSLYDKNPIKYVISEKAKEALKKCKYKDILCKENYKCCCITQDDFLDEDDVIQLPCEHLFFPEPIIKWLTEESSSCPVCKKTLESIEVKTEKPLYNSTFLDETFFDTFFMNTASMYHNFSLDEDTSINDID